MSCYQQSLTILAQIHLCLPTVKKNCAELYKSGKTTSGVYTIDPDGLGAFKSSVTKRQPVGGGGEDSVSELILSVEKTEKRLHRYRQNSGLILENFYKVNKIKQNMLVVSSNWS